MTPLPEQEVTIPFGAILENVRQDRDSVTFNYLTEPYGCPRDVFQSAVAGGARDEWAAVTARELVSDGVVPEFAPEPAKLQFEALSSNIHGLSRAKVPGGWLISSERGGVAFYPDARHAWNGESK
jgi:hypothetical protein